MTFRLGDVAHLPLPLSTERHNRQRGCEGKVRHRTEATARAQMETLYASKKAAPGSLGLYGCRFCQYIHVGHV